MSFEIRRSRRIMESGGRRRTSNTKTADLDNGKNSGNKLHLDRHSQLDSTSTGIASTTNKDSQFSQQSLLNRRYNLAGKKVALRLDTEALQSPHRIRVPVFWPASANDLRYLHFQKFREYLWQQGRRHFGDGSAADVFVLPAQLPDSQVRPSHLIGRGRYSTIKVHTVVHSEGQSPIGMAREFDFASLQATVPEPTPSPRTPNFDSRGLLSAIMSVDTETASQNFSSKNKSKVIEKSKTTRGGRRARASASQRLPQAVPMHIHYARAHLPVLAAIMMSRQVRRGDTIELPVPYPEAWPETVAFVYTGEEELATIPVRENIHHLGGKTW